MIRQLETWSTTDNYREEAHGGLVVGRTRGGRGGTRLLLFAMKRSLVGGILLCLLESQRKQKRRGEMRKENVLREYKGEARD